MGQRLFRRNELVRDYWKKRKIPTAIFPFFFIFCRGWFVLNLRLILRKVEDKPPVESRWRCAKGENGARWIFHAKSAVESLQRNPKSSRAKETKIVVTLTRPGFTASLEVLAMVNVRSKTSISPFYNLQSSHVENNSTLLLFIPSMIDFYWT